MPSEWRPVPSHPPKYWIVMFSISWYCAVMRNFCNQQFCEFFFKCRVVSMEVLGCRFFSGSSVARTLSETTFVGRRMSSALYC